MRVVFSIRPFHRHLQPIVPLALELSRSGHEVAIATADELGPAVVAAGVAWWPAGIHPSTAAELFPDDDADYGIEAVSLKVTDLLEIMIGEFRPDVVVRDPTDLAPAVVAAALKIPSGTFGFANFIPRSSWPILGGDTTMATLRARYGLAPDPDLDTLYSGLYLSAVPPLLESLEPLPVSRLQRVRYHTSDPEEFLPLPDRLDGLQEGPTVLVTAEAAKSHRRPLETALVALATEGFTVICTLKGSPDRDDLANWPESVHFVDCRLYSRILPMSDAVIWHGGFDTMMGALSAGVPLVCLPNDSNGEYNGTRAQERGLGLLISDDDLQPGAIAGAVHTVVRDRSFRERARAMRREVEAMPDLAEAVRSLEEFAAGSA